MPELIKAVNEAICKVRDVKSIFAFTPNPEKHAKTISYIKLKTGIDIQVRRNLVLDCRTFIDYASGIDKEQGPVFYALQDGFPKERLSELATVVNDQSFGRKDENEILYFQSLGVMHENLAAIEYIYNKLSV